MLAIADRLVQDRDSWKPFNPRRYFPPSLQWMVPMLYPPKGNAQKSRDITTLAETG